MFVSSQYRLVRPLVNAADARPSQRRPRGELAERVPVEVIRRAFARGKLDSQNV
jgi:hypothetical protein